MAACVTLTVRVWIQGSELLGVVASQTDTLDGKTDRQWCRTR